MASYISERFGWFGYPSINSYTRARSDARTAAANFTQEFQSRVDGRDAEATDTVAAAETSDEVRQRVFANYDTNYSIVLRNKKIANYTKVGLLVAFWASLGVAIVSQLGATGATGYGLKGELKSECGTNGSDIAGFVANVLSNSFNVLTILFAGAQQAASDIGSKYEKVDENEHQQIKFAMATIEATLNTLDRVAQSVDRNTAAIADLDESVQGCATRLDALSANSQQEFKLEKELVLAALIELLPPESPLKQKYRDHLERLSRLSMVGHAGASTTTLGSLTASQGRLSVDPSVDGEGAPPTTPKPQRRTADAVSIGEAMNITEIGLGPLKHMYQKLDGKFVKVSLPS